MDTSPIPGFITRKQASERCKRAERTLQRNWSRAIELKDMAVLKHLKLRTEDGEITDGPEVTKDLIDRLKKRGQNPKWYARADWVVKSYGPRSGTEQAVPQKKINSNTHLEDGNLHAVDSDTVVLLKEQLANRNEEVAYLREELAIKNQQITEANARTRESNTLMQQLQQLLGDWQKQAFKTLPASTESQPSQPCTTPVVVRHTSPSQSQKGVAGKRAKAAGRKGKPASAARPNKSPKSGCRKKPLARKPKWYETPTLKLAASRLLRRWS